MAFKILTDTDKKFEIVKQHVLNKDGFTKKYCILDSTVHTPFYFKCPVCKTNSTNIDLSNTQTFQSQKFQIDLDSITALGGTGIMCKIIQCENCSANYFVGIGYTEPNNGRDVFLLHTIIEIK